MTSEASKQLLSSLPKVNWPEGVPDGTWVCGCGDVQYRIKKFGMYHGECYCVNCQVATKVAQSKQTADYNHLSPDTGAHWFVQAMADEIEFDKGYDKLGFYRCAVTAPGECTGAGYKNVYKENCGEAYKEVIQFHNIITECCGTKVGICNPGHVAMVDLDNPYRVKGWRPLPKKDRAVFDACSAPKIGLTWDGQGISFGPVTNDPCTCRAVTETCKGCCCGCCMTSCFGSPCHLQRYICGMCCPCCCRIQVDPKFQPAPMGCTEHCGKEMEYITDAHFLKPKADPPKQATMSVTGDPPKYANLCRELSRE